MKPQHSAARPELRLPSILVGVTALGLLGLVLHASREPFERSSESPAPVDVASLPSAELTRPTAPARAPRPGGEGHRHATPDELVAAVAGALPPSIELLPWDEARELARVEALRIHEQNAPFTSHHVTGGWTSPVTGDSLLMRFRLSPDDLEVDAEQVAAEVREVVGDLRAEMSWLADQYAGVRDSVVARVLAGEPRRSRSPLPPTGAVRGGIQKITLDPATTGGWYVRYEMRTAEHPELLHLEQEILPLVGRATHMARKVIDRYRVQRTAHAGALAATVASDAPLGVR